MGLLKRIKSIFKDETAPVKTAAEFPVVKTAPQSPAAKVTPLTAEERGYEIGLNGTATDIINESSSIRERVESGEISSISDMINIWKGFSEGSRKAFLQGRPENIQYFARTTISFLNGRPMFDEAFIDLLTMSKNPDPIPGIALAKLDQFQKQKVLDRVLLHVIHNSNAYTKAVPLALLKAGANEPFYPNGTPEGIKALIQEAKNPPPTSALAPAKKLTT